MKAQIEVLLSLWGKWAVRRESKALGFPSISPMFRDSPRGDAYGSAPPMGFAEADILFVDAAVMRLTDVHRLVVIECYQRPGSFRDHAMRLGIHHKSMTQYLNQAHEKIDIDIRDQCAQNPVQIDSVYQCAQARPAAAR